MNPAQLLTITDDVSVNKLLIKMQSLRQFAPHLLATAAKMESVERWTFDDLVLDGAGEPVGVNDERGTGQERMQVLTKLQASLAGRSWESYVATQQYTDLVDMPLIELLSKIKTRRFLACAYWIERSNPRYMRHLLKRVLDTAATNISAHVLRSRLDRLNRLNVMSSIFSEESVKQVQAALLSMNSD